MKKRLLIYLVTLITVVAAGGGRPAAASGGTSEQPALMRYHGLDTHGSVWKVSAQGSSHWGSHSPAFTAADLPVINSGAELADLSSRLAELVETEAWNELGLSSRRQAEWEDFAGQAAALPEPEIQLVRVFLSQYEFLANLRDRQVIPERSTAVLRVREFESPSGHQRLAVFAAAHESIQDGRGQRLYLIAYDSTGQASALVLAPEIQGLQQRVSNSGQLVEYLAPGGEWLLRADARQLDLNRPYDDLLHTRLQLDGLDPLYINSRTYPRFHFNLRGIASGFYAVEKLTLNQMRLLVSTLELFERPELRALKRSVFLPADEVAYVLTRDPRPAAAAAAMVVSEEPPQAIVLLYTRILFENRYLTAAALSHEAAHVWQGLFGDCEHPAQILQSEIGERTIPSGMLDWPGERLVQGINSKEIGAYHVSMWVLDKFNQQEMVSWSRTVIQNGNNNGNSLLMCEYSPTWAAR